MPEFMLPLTINGLREEVRFANYPLINKRKTYDIELLRGLDAEGKISSRFEYPLEHSVEWTLLEFVKTGDPAILETRNLKIVENPGKDVISRNLTLLDPERCEMYVVGSIGLIQFDKDAETLTLENPILDQTFHDYQERYGRNPGGVMYISENGISGKENETPLGVSHLEGGPYNSLLEKVDKTQTIGALGIRTPDYLAVGRIKNLGKGEWGFSLYKTAIQPDYLKNLKLYLDQSVNFKDTFVQYLSAKYQTLRVLHEVAKRSHGQPTVENAGGIIEFDDQMNGKGACILKDMDTLRPIPESLEKTILDGPCPQRIGINIRKSPHVAAQIYDLQLALTQELNILLIASKPMPNIKVKMQFLQYQFSIMVKAVCRGYGINTEEQSAQIVHFCFEHYVKALNKGLPFDEFNEVLGGLCANAMFGLSQLYQSQIEVVPES